MRTSLAHPLRSLRSTVEQALDNALDNDYPVDKDDANEVAEDLVQHHPDLEGCAPAALAPLVAQWQRNRSAA